MSFEVSELHFNMLDDMLKADGFNLRPQTAISGVA
jgi:hypothetical protein